MMTGNGNGSRLFHYLLLILRGPEVIKSVVWPPVCTGVDLAFIF